MWNLSPLLSLKQRWVGQPSEKDGRAKCTYNSVILPYEVLELVLTDLRQEDILSFSCTCKAYRQLVAPLVFRVLHLSSDVNRNSAAMSAPLPAERYAAFVEAVNFTAVAYNEWDRPPEHERADAGGMLLSKTAAELLSNLRRFPRLRTLRVRFSTLRYKDTEAAYFRLDTFAQQPGDTDAATMKVRERTTPWRAIVVETWLALASNDQDKAALPHLIIEHQPPIPFSVFHEPPVIRLLGRLDALTLVPEDVLYSSKMGIEQQSFAEVDAFKDEVREGLVRHLHHLRRLHIAAGPDHALCYTSSRNMPPLPLAAHSLPRLECLELERIVVGTELTKFLTTLPLDEEKMPYRPRPLRRLTLTNCFCCTGGFDEQAWHQLFRSLMSDQLSSLEEVNVRVPEHICTKPGKLFSDPSLPRYASAVWTSDNNFPYVKAHALPNTLETSSLPADIHEADKQAYNELQEMLAGRRQ